MTVVRHKAVNGIFDVQLFEEYLALASAGVSVGGGTIDSDVVDIEAFDRLKDKKCLFSWLDVFKSVD